MWLKNDLHFLYSNIDVIELTRNVICNDFLFELAWYFLAIFINGIPGKQLSSDTALVSIRQIDIEKV